MSDRRLAPPTLTPVEVHLADCLGIVEPLAPTQRRLEDALDAVLAEDVSAPGPLPGFDSSAMDGYAVHAADVAGATAGLPARLPVVADVPAGAGIPPPLPSGSAARVMTGAVLPEGTDAIVPVEDTDAGLATVTVRVPTTAGRFVRRAGEDVAAGEHVLAAGTRLGPRQLGLLAALGRASVLVRPAPVVAVLSSGDEVVAPGAPLEPGQVHDANGVALAAAVAELGATPVRVGPVADEEAAVRAAVEEQLRHADVVITSGGVSAGAYDVVKAVLRRAGTVEFRRVAVQPGMPQGVGVLGPDRVPLYCLPGNPVSAMVSFEVFVRPALRSMMGEEQLHRRAVPAEVLSSWTAPPGKRQYARVLLQRRPEPATERAPDRAPGPGPGPAAAAAPAAGPGTGQQRYVAEAVGAQRSHLVAHLAEANALAVVPEDVTEVSPGDVLDCLVLERVRR